MFGITIALANPAAEIVAVDWKNVLQVAHRKRDARGCSGSLSHARPAALSTVDFGTGYDLVLLTEFPASLRFPTNVALIKKVRAALKPGGRVLTVEFVPNDDRVRLPTAAAFSMMMLGATNGGDAYTFSELEANVPRRRLLFDQLIQRSPHRRGNYW